MADSKSGRRVVVAAALMIIVGQILAIANDVILRMRDSSDVVLLVVLVSTIPALASLHAPVIAFATSPAFALLVGSLAFSALLDLCAVWMLAFAPSVRSYFAAQGRWQPRCDRRGA